MLPKLQATGPVRDTGHYFTARVRETGPFLTHVAPHKRQFSDDTYFTPLAAYRTCDTPARRDTSPTAALRHLFLLKSREGGRQWGGGGSHPPLPVPLLFSRHSPYFGSEHMRELHSNYEQFVLMQVYTLLLYRSCEMKKCKEPLGSRNEGRTHASIKLC